MPETHTWEIPGVNGVEDERPRLLRLRGLLDEWQLDAELAHLRTQRALLEDRSRASKDWIGNSAEPLHLACT